MVTYRDVSRDFSLLAFSALPSPLFHALKQFQLLFQIHRVVLNLKLNLRYVVLLGGVAS
jgi:hypothetical protein